MGVKVYWPSDLLNTKRIKNVGNAVVLGSLINDTSIVVINILHYHDIKDLLDQQIIQRHDSGKLVVTDTQSSISIIGWFGDALDTTQGLLKFDVESNVIKSQSAILIVFDPPLPKLMQFYSTVPISIYLSKGHRPEPSQDTKLQKLLNEFKPCDKNESELDLDASIAELNLCWKKRQELLNEFPHIEVSWESKGIIRKVFNLTQRFVSRSTNFYHKLILGPSTVIILYIIIGIRHLTLNLLTVLNMKLFDELPRLIELSATAQQIDLRLQQFAYFPIQYVRTTKNFDYNNTDTRKVPLKAYPEYIRFYNTLWLIINDVTIGIAIRAFLIENRVYIAKVLEQIVVSKLLYSDLNQISIWLMKSPGGIKLNNELSNFLSELFRWVIEFWKATLLDSIVPHLQEIVTIIAFCSTFGATFAIAIFSDFLSLITLHIYCFYYASARIFNWQLNILLSLFHLFCGKKRNVLRNRIDSNDYGLDQLLLGTLLFIVVTFLLPTVLSFYVAFTITESTIFLVVGVFELVMALLNHFPLFLLLLRVKDSQRVPSGIKFINRMNYIKLASKPIGIGEIFLPYTNVWKKLRSSYLSKKTLSSILYGHPIHIQRNKLYKLLYSTLPSNPIPTAELWKEFNDSLEKTIV